MIRSKFSRLAVLNFILLTVIFPFQNCSNGKYQSVIQSPAENSSSSIAGELPAAEIPVVVAPPAVPPQLSGNLKTVVIAAGQNERTMMSCDDGTTWFNDRSADDAATGEIIGGHSPRSFYGMDAADGYMYVNYGWGYNGSLKRSRDGINWDVVRSGSWGGGIAAFNQQIFHAGPDWSTSITNGSSWTKILNIDSVANGISYGAIHHVNDKIFIVGRGANMGVSYDKGSTWKLLTNVLPTQSQLMSFAEGNGVIVIVGKTYIHGMLSAGYITRSVDNGQTWTSKQIGNDWSSIVFNGTHFVAWSNASDNAKTYKSTDGLNWTIVNTKINGANSGWYFAPNAKYNKYSGNYIAMGTSGGDIGTQQVYRSNDGIDWLKIDSSSIKRGNYTDTLHFTELDAAYCK